MSPHSCRSTSKTLTLGVLLCGALLFAVGVAAEDPALDSTFDAAISSVGLAQLAQFFPFDELEFSCNGGAEVEVTVPGYSSTMKSAGSKTGTPQECQAWRRMAAANAACNPPPTPVAYTAADLANEQRSAEGECENKIQNKLSGIVVTCAKPSEAPACKKGTCEPIKTSALACPQKRPTTEEFVGITGRVAADGSCTLSCYSRQTAPPLSFKVKIGCTECER